MKHRFAVFFVLFLLTIRSFASHITGGEMYYTLVSQAGNNYTYAITLKLFRDPGSSAGLDANAAIAIFEKGTGLMVWNGLVPLANQTTITLSSPGPCIVNPPVVSYNIGYYNFNVTLPGSQNGYIVAYQRCCRVTTLTNVSGSGNIGATYTAEIPGFEPISSAPANNSARFLGVDTVIICEGYPFKYNFGASDPDGDSLRYMLCTAYSGGSTTTPAPNPPLAPPYNSVPYAAPFGQATPLGSGVSINSFTGEITGTAPTAGVYVVTVCVQEWRNGVVIATQRKDLQIKVADCDIAAVTLEPDGYIDCTDFTVSFANLTPSSFINSYFWDFGDLSTAGDTSLLSSPTYTYPDTGVYFVKVVANRNLPCSDSTTAPVRVYPGFIPDFSFTGSCLNFPVQFNDQSFAAHGNINFWHWDFGVGSTLADTSNLQNPQYSYTATGSYTVELIVGSDKGCRDTVYKNPNILDKPPLNLSFRDTLICSIDSVQLQASGSGTFSWLPNYNILNNGSATPVVYPKNPTWYTVELNENGCLNRDSVLVQVVDSVTLIVSNDTTICSNDAAQLSASTDGLQYNWSPSSTLSNPGSLNTIASPVGTTTYQFNSVIGGCSATKNITVLVVSRPFADAGPDTTICFNTSAQLNAQHGGTGFTWMSDISLDDPGLLNPVATPGITTAYILAVTDINSGCPKPSYDTVIVNVLPEVMAFAGRDTVSIAGLPLQLLATGGVNYSWSPSTGLSNPSISNPVTMLDGNPEYIRYSVLVSDQAGCSDTASINIRVYKTGPEIFVPTGFTPNGDGRNDVFRPIYVAMKSVEYFRVYNRWGQLIYSNNQQDGNGWDGSLSGIKQNSGIFIWMVKATDILGNSHFKKGTVLLIR